MLRSTCSTHQGLQGHMKLVGMKAAILWALVIWAEGFSSGISTKVQTNVRP
jgi:hypothetical protein